MMKYDRKGFEKAERILPEERAVAVVVGGSTHAVMMASPSDLEDFAAGFLFTEDVIDSADEIEAIEILPQELGVEIQIRLVAEKTQNYQTRRRAMIGPVGCGLCGVESLELALPDLEAVTPLTLDDDFPWRALEALGNAQSARKISGAIHGAAILNLAGDVILAREDIGRHNAIDKVIGAAKTTGLALEGHVLVSSSRVSLDLVVKAARARVGAFVARATPSDLAVKYAQKLKLPLIAPVFNSEYYTTGEKS